MDKKVLIQYLFLAIFVLAFIWVALDDLSVHAKNGRFYDTCVAEQQRIISVCKIDYNAWLVEQQQQGFLDLNKSFQGISNGVN